MVEPKHIELLQRLVGKTASGQIDWRPALIGDAIEFVNDDLMVEVARYTGLDGTEPGTYCIRLRDASSGVLIDQVWDSEFRGGPGVPADFDAGSALQELFTSARRKAYAADNAWDRLLAALGPVSPA